MFLESKIHLADKAIVENTLKKLHNGDVILIFAKYIIFYLSSSIVFKLLKEAFFNGIDFRVIVCDARPLLEGIILISVGKEMLKSLANVGIKCTYIFTNALGSIMKEVIQNFNSRSQK